MKKVKIILNGLGILLVVANTLSFRVVKFHTPNLYYFSKSFKCKLSANATNKPGSVGTPTYEVDFASGYYTDAPVPGRIPGCQTSAPVQHAADGL